MSGRNHKAKRTRQQIVAATNKRYAAVLAMRKSGMRIREIAVRERCGESRVRKLLELARDRFGGAERRAVVADALTELMRDQALSAPLQAKIAELVEEWREPRWPATPQSWWRER